MKCVVSGGSGFIGQAVVDRLAERGEVVVLSRNPRKVRNGRGVFWNPPSVGDWETDVGQADVIINLAGDNIGSGRWTDAKKQRMLSSRLDSTRALVRALRSRGEGRRPVFFSASAVGYYGSRGDQLLDEGASAGDNFLARLAQQWEAAAMEASGHSRLVIGRFGVVIDGSGGMVGKLLLPFRLFLGGPIGSGDQWLSWVDRRDLVAMIEWLIDRPEAEGVYNITSPEPVTNRQFTKTLGTVLHRPAALTAPRIPLKLALGEMADDMLLASQRAVPKRATDEGFSFQCADLGESLRRALGSD